MNTGSIAEETKSADQRLEASGDTTERDLDFDGLVSATLSALGIGGADQSRETVLEHVIQNAGFDLRPLVDRLERFGVRHAEHEIDLSEIYSVAFALHSFLDRLQLAERITGGEFGEARPPSE